MRRSPAHALQHLREAHGDALSTYCLRLTGSPDAAAAAVEETFAAAHERLTAGRTPRDARTALFADAREACLRRVADGDPAVVGAPAAAGEDGVLAASARLPLRHRELLVLRDLERMPLEQIAAITGRTPHASAHLAWRARGALQAALPGGIPAAAVAPTPDCESVLTLEELRSDRPLAPAEERWRSGHVRDCRRCGAGRAAIAGVGERYRAAAVAAGAGAPALAAAVPAGAAVAAASGPAATTARQPRAAPAATASRRRGARPASAVVPAAASRGGPARLARTAVPAAAAAATSRRRLAGVVLVALLAFGLAAGLLASSGEDDARSALEVPTTREDATPPAEADASPEPRASRDDRSDAPAARREAGDRSRPARGDRPRRPARDGSRRTRRERARRSRRADRTAARRPAARGDAPASARTPAPATPAAPAAAAPAAAPAPQPAPPAPAPAPAPAPQPDPEPAPQPPPPEDKKPPCEDGGDKKGNGKGCKKG